MGTKLPYGVYPDKRKNGKWVLIEMTGISRTSTTHKVWPPSLLPNGRGRQFDTYQEARKWACGGHKDATQ